jgi:S1-C subfamily serine protease
MPKPTAFKVDQRGVTTCSECGNGPLSRETAVCSLCRATLYDDPTPTRTNKLLIPSIAAIATLFIGGIVFVPMAIRDTKKTAMHELEDMESKIRDRKAKLKGQVRVASNDDVAAVMDEVQTSKQPMNLVSLSSRAILNPSVVQGLWQQRYSTLAPSIVRIESLSNEGDSIGTGFAYRHPNLIVTASHCLAGASAIRVIYTNGMYSDNVKVLYDNPYMDVALIAVPVQAPSYLSPSNGVLPGSSIASIGHPKGVNMIMSYGTLVQRYRQDEWLEMRMPLDHGNSGGPVVDDQCHVLGVVSAGFASDLTRTIASPIWPVEEFIRQNPNMLR